jgi:hypothetical protein
MLHVKRGRDQLATETATETATELTEDATDLYDLVPPPPSDELYFDLSKCMGVDFKITRTEAMLLGRNMDLPHEKWDTIPVHPNDDGSYSEVQHFRKTSNIFAAGASGFVIAGTYGGKNCIAKVMSLQNMSLKQVMQEVLIQSIVSEQIGDDCHNCTKVPEIYAVLRTRGFLHERTKVKKQWQLNDSRVEDVVMIVMQHISRELGSYIQDLHPSDRSIVCAAVLCQTSNLFAYLKQKQLNFMHADLKINNVTFDIDPDGPSRYKTYIIDFGLSSIDYKNVRLGAGLIFRTLRYRQSHFTNFHTDMTYLVWSMWRFQSCDMTLREEHCTKYTPLFSRVLRFILLSSGIPFSDDRSFDHISMDTFHAMMTAGMSVDSVDTEHKYVSSAFLNPLAITYGQINHYMTLYLIAAGSPLPSRKKAANNQLIKLTTTASSM